MKLLFSTVFQEPISPKFIFSDPEGTHESAESEQQESQTKGPPEQQDVQDALNNGDLSKALKIVDNLVEDDKSVAISKASHVFQKQKLLMEKILGTSDQWDEKTKKILQQAQGSIQGAVDVFENNALDNLRAYHATIGVLDSTAAILHNQTTNIQSKRVADSVTPSPEVSKFSKESVLTFCENLLTNDMSTISNTEMNTFLKNLVSSGLIGEMRAADPLKTKMEGLIDSRDQQNDLEINVRPFLKQFIDYHRSQE